VVISALFSAYFSEQGVQLLLEPYAPSSPNRQELGNQCFDANSHSGNLSSQGQLYYNDFFNNSPLGGINVQSELYDLRYAGGGNNTLQAKAAIQTAFQNYLLYLAVAGQTTGNNGTPSTCNSTATCPPIYSF